MVIYKINSEFQAYNKTSEKMNLDNMLLPGSLIPRMVLFFVKEAVNHQ